MEDNGKRLCDDGYGMVDALEFYTDIALPGDSAGFSIVGVDDAPITEVTIKDITFYVAYPQGLVNDITVASGSYTVSYNDTASIDGAPYNTYEVYKFTYIGSTKGKTVSDLLSPWAGSMLRTEVDFNNSICVPSVDKYYVALTGSFTTKNGVTKDIDLGRWVESTMGQSS